MTGAMWCGVVSLTGLVLCFGVICYQAGRRVEMKAQARRVRELTESLRDKRNDLERINLRMMRGGRP